MITILGSIILTTDDKARSETDTVLIFKTDDKENKQINTKKSR